MNMKRMAHNFLLTLGVWITTSSAVPAMAVELRPGHPAPAFELYDTQGNLHRLSDYVGKVLVLHFQSCRCPWDQAYQPILNEMVKHLASSPSQGTNPTQIAFLAINSNRTELPDQIKAYHASGAVAYPIVKDPANRIANEYGAMTTPHIFVVNKDPKQTLAYVGGIEKAPLSPQACGSSQEQYLLPVLKALRDGAAVPYSHTQSVGCSIKRE